MVPNWTEVDDKITWSVTHIYCNYQDNIDGNYKRVRGTAFLFLNEAQIGGRFNVSFY